MNKTKSKIMIVMCVALLVMAVGYAAFSTVLTITGTANIASEWKVVFTDITQVSKTDGVTEKATPSASGTTATFDVGLTSPGDKIVYKITLANQGTIDALITNIEASATDSPAIIFTIDGVNIGDELGSKTSKEFNVTIEYDPYVTSQPEKLQKTLTVSIVTAQKINQSIDQSTPSVDQPTYLRSEILKNNVAYADTDIDFSKTSEETGTNGLYYTNTNTENNLTTYYFRGAVENNYVQFGKLAEPVNACTYNNEYVPYVIDLANTEINMYPTEEQCLSTNVCDVGTFLKENYGVYADYRYIVGVDEATCSYLSGTMLTQKAIYSSINDMYWKIVRINEDGSIRLIYQGITVNNIGTDLGDISFNSNDDDNAYVGYMYGTPGSNTYEATHSNTNDSTIKEVIDNWYETNLKTNYGSYLADAGFCNDRSVAPSAGLWQSYDTALGYGTNVTYYGAYNRLYTNKKPQFACPNASNDLFTTSSSTKGNKALTYPIGLITADEVSYAGGPFGEYNGTHYLNSQDMNWTMTPHEMLSGAAVLGMGGVNITNIGGKLSYYSVSDDDSLTARPVINLKSNIEITKGNGTRSNPYIIKAN